MCVEQKPGAFNYSRLQSNPRTQNSVKIYLILLIIVTINVETMQLHKIANPYLDREESDSIMPLTGPYVEKPKQNTNHVWRVIDPNESYPCILLHGSLEFKIPNLEQTDMKTLKVPEDAVAEGSCSTLWNDYQEIKLSWNSSISNTNITVLNSVYFGFATNWISDFSDLSIPSEQYALNSMTVVYHGGGLNESTLMSYSVADFIAFLTPRHRSYSCSSDNKLSIGELELTTSNFRLQAFSSPNSGSGEFADSIECNVDENYSIWNGILEFIKWFSVASTVVIAVVAIFYVLLCYIQKRLESWNISYKVLWTSWS